MKRFLLPFLFLFCAMPSWSAPPDTITKAKQRSIFKEPYTILMAIDPANSSKLIPVLIDATGAIVTGVGGLPVGASTEAKQDDLNALIVIIDAVLDAMKLDTANLTNDPSTATLQTAANVILATIDAVLDLIKLDTANISNDQATATLQTAASVILATIDAVLDLIKLDTANLTSDPSTATLQSDLNALIATMDAVLDLMLVDTGNIDTNTTGLAGTVAGSEQQVDVVTLPSVLVADANNTTTTPLGIGATFTGTATDLLTNGNPHVLVTVFADEDSAAGGLIMQFSQDGTNWEAGSTKHAFTLDADEERTFQFGPEAQFFRAVLTNGGTAQTAFRLSTMLKRNIGYTTMHRVDDTITADRSVIGITKSLSMVQKPDLTFTNRKATAGGVAKVAISEHEAPFPAGTNLMGKVGAESPHSTLDSADATTGWTALGDASNIATSTTHIEGTLALEWDKAGGTEVTSGLQKTIDTEQTPGHATDVLLHCMLYIQDAPDLATVDFGFMRVGEDASNYLEFQVAGADMMVGWNHKNFTLTSPTSQTGAGLSTGIIKYVAFGVATNNAADTFDDMLGDDFHYDETLSAAVVSAPSSDVDLGSVRIRDRNSNTQMDVETDGANKAAHVMSNSMASESTLGTIDTDTGNIATSAASIDTDTSTIASDTTSLDGKTPSQGEAAMAASVPVVIASDQSPVTVISSENALPLGAPEKDHKSVVTGVGPTLILAADTGRRFITICNAFTDLVSFGNSDVTLNSAAATDGPVLAAAGAAGDGTGGCKTEETTGAYYVKGTSASSKVTVSWGTNL